MFNLLGRERPKLNLAFVYDNGTVWQFFMNGIVPYSNKIVLKLPKSNYYHGYSNEQGVLYFIHSDIRKSITKYHKKFSNEGHKTVPKSGFQFDDPENKVEYTKGTLISKGFWVIGKENRCKPLNPHYPCFTEVLSIMRLARKVSNQILQR